jgi:hypothetical protein
MPYTPLLTPVSEIILQSPFNGTFSEEQFEQIDIDKKEYHAAMGDIRERLNVKLKTGRYSEVLIAQLARHRMNIYEKFGNEIHAYHFQTILDIIENVDSGRSANIRGFKNPLLSSFQHIHHNSNTFIPQNMLNHWRNKYGQNDEIQYQNMLLKDIYFDLLKDHEDDIAQNKALTALLTKIQYESKFRPIASHTGEWIIFSEKKGIKYFLCLATHKEAKDSSDQVILDRLAPCLLEFPEIVPSSL